MADERSQKTGWTVDTLHEHLVAIIREFRQHVDSQFTNQTKAVETALIAAGKAVDAAMAAAGLAAEKAEQQGDKWRASANEWRAAMNDREAMFMPRLQAEAAFKALEEKV